MVTVQAPIVCFYNNRIMKRGKTRLGSCYYMVFRPAPLFVAISESFQHLHKYTSAHPGHLYLNNPRSNKIQHSNIQPNQRLPPTSITLTLQTCNSNYPSSFPSSPPPSLSPPPPPISQSPQPPTARAPPSSKNAITTAGSAPSPATTATARTSALAPNSSLTTSATSSHHPVKPPISASTSVADGTKWTQ